MDVLVPFDADEPKSRLSDVLEPDERSAFARSMLLDLCETVVDAGGDPTVLSTAPLECPHEVVVDDRPLTEAVNAHLESPMAIVMADLALATPASLRRLFEADADVGVAPGLGGGTNAMVVRHPDFYVDYHGASVRDHRRIARHVDAELETIDSFRLAVDVDEPADFAEVLLHGSGRSLAWLEDAGFALVTTDGRVSARRDGD